MTGAEVLALAALAGTAAGTGLQMHAATQTRNKENDLVGQELARQRGYQQKGGVEYQKSLAQSTPKAAQGQIDVGAANREEDLQKASQVPMATGTPLDLADPNPVANAQTAGILSQQASAKAKMGGYSDYDLEQWIKNLRAQQTLGMYSQFARNSQQALPYELQAAGNQYSTENSVGGLVSQLGMLAGLAGASGIGKSASPTPALGGANQFGGARMPTLPGVQGGFDYSMFRGPYA